MSYRGWVGWVMANRVTAAGLALSVSVALIGLGLVAVEAEDDTSTTTALESAGAGTGDDGSPGGVGSRPGDGTGAGEDAAPLPGEEAGPDGTVAPTPGAPGAPAGGDTGPTPAPGGGSAPGPGAPLPGQTPTATRCVPQDVDGTGISKDEVVIGQIVSDVSVLPAQLKPNYEGLQAYVNLVNQAGGVCGRKIRIEYSNDNANPATHEYQAMTGKVFAFVGNSSLIDQQDYQADAPFEPLHKDGDEFVPDVGGLAYSYNRNQSQWFAGVVGSLSPSLVGGGQFKWMIDQARADGRPCRKAGVVYLREPNGSSEDQGRLGGASLAADFGGGLGSDNVEYYVANLGDPVVVYEQIAAQMVSDGVNCAFTYMDLGSNINFVKGLANRGVWPPDTCTGPQCFSVVYIPFAGYDPKFIRDAGDASKSVLTYLPHLPLNQTDAAPMRQYLKALESVRGAEPSTFSLIGYNSGQLFVRALQACGGAPTRACVMDHLRKLRDFDGGGLQGAVTPFQSTRVDCSGGCGNFRGRGTYDFKWIFTCTVAVQVQDRGGARDFHRVHPPQGYACDTLQIVRGKAA